MATEMNAMNAMKDGEEGDVTKKMKELLESVRCIDRETDLLESRLGVLMESTPVPEIKETMPLRTYKCVLSGEIDENIAALYRISDRLTSMTNRLQI